MSERFYPNLGLLIHGEWLSSGRSTRPVYNPGHGSVIAELPLATAEDIDEAVHSAQRAFHSWKKVSAYERARILADVATRIRGSEEMLARIITLEQGKPLGESLSEIRSCADNFDWMAEEGKRLYGRLVPARVVGLTQLATREPVGPVAGFSPWNFPASLACRKVATALAAGCSIVLKPAEETPGIMVAIGKICIEAGVLPGAFNLLFGNPDEISAQLIGDSRIKKISFTGSVPVGKHLANLAGAQMKKITLELGGHAPVIVMDDADVNHVVDLTIAAKFRNAGQLCVCPTRFYVQSGVYETFVDALSRRAKSIRVGDGFDSETQMGPLANSRRIAAIDRLCQDALDRGATLQCGGQRPDGVAASGFYWAPTVLADVPVDALAMNEEPFGPLSLVNPFDDIQEAIQQANSLDVGLASYAFTNSLRHADLLEQSLEYGNVCINTYFLTPPEVPFGGIKSSGLGAEMGQEGLLDHTYSKVVYRSSF